MDLQLAGKLALVTGASKGIGLAVTAALVAEGAHVVAGSRTSSPELAELEAAGQVTFVAADLSTAEGPHALATAAGARGGIDILVNNAGAVSPRPGGFASVTDDDWLASWTLTLMAAVRTTRAALPLMSGPGSTIVTVSSVNAVLPDPGVVDYSAMKAALTNVFKSLSKEMGPKGIRVNTVSPGPVATGLWLGTGGVADVIANAGGGTAEDVAASAAADSATGRFTTPQEVADLVVLLASSRAGNVTGSDFTIDGGLIKTL